VRLRPLLRRMLVESTLRPPLSRRPLENAFSLSVSHMI
jgi:hypothetical protein